MNWLFSILLGCAVVLLVGQAVNLHNMRRGDGFSRSMAVSMGAICSCVLYGLILGLLGLARLKGLFPSFSGWVVWVAFLLGVVASLHINQLMRNDEHSRWWIASAVLPAVLLMAWSVMVRFEITPSWLRDWRISGLIWGGTLALTAAVLFVGRGGKT